MAGFDIWQRTLSVYVDVEDDWLDPSGDGQDAHADGWEQMRDKIRKAIGECFPSDHRGGPHFDVDWDGIPVRKE